MCGTYKRFITRICGYTVAVGIAIISMSTRLAAVSHPRPIESSILARDAFPDIMKARFAFTVLVPLMEIDSRAKEAPTPSDKRSASEALNLPKNFELTFLFVGLVLIFTPLLSGAGVRLKLPGLEIRLPKITEFTRPARRSAQVLGTACVFVAVAIAVPILPVRPSIGTTAVQVPAVTDPSTTPAPHQRPSAPRTDGKLTVNTECTQFTQSWHKQALAYLAELDGIEKNWSTENWQIESLAERVAGTLPEQFDDERERINAKAISSKTTKEIAEALRTQLKKILDRLAVEPCN